jgi:hypothetical protein
MNEQRFAAPNCTSHYHWSRLKSYDLDSPLSTGQCPIHASVPQLAVLRPRACSWKRLFFIRSLRRDLKTLDFRFLFAYSAGR